MVELADGICLESRRTARFRGFKSLSLRFLFWQRIWIHNPNSLLFLFFIVLSRMPRHSCCEVRVMQLHDILLLRTSVSLHSVSVGAKPLSTGQCAPCRRLYQLGDWLPPLIPACFFSPPIEVEDISQLIYLFSKNVQKYGNVWISFSIPIFPLINFIPNLISG